MKSNEIEAAIDEQLQAMSERLEIDVAAAVRTVLEKSRYFIPEGLDKLVYPITGWACSLPYEAHDHGLVIFKKT